MAGLGRDESVNSTCDRAKPSPALQNCSLPLTVGATALARRLLDLVVVEKNSVVFVDRENSMMMMSIDIWIPYCIDRSQNRS